MTVHASKGLEFKYVFITGLEQDLFASGTNSSPSLLGETDWLQQPTEEVEVGQALRQLKTELRVRQVGLSSVLRAVQFLQQAEMAQHLFADFGFRLRLILIVKVVDLGPQVVQLFIER